MKILLLSFYFEPDLSAGSFRNTALVRSLLELLPEGSEIHLVTTLPNRYSGFTVEAPEDEVAPCLAIKRVRLPAHKSGMVDQSRAFATYARQVTKFAKGNSYDLIFASSSRLMTAVLGAWLARRQNVPLYLDIRDIFVDTIKDVLPRKLTWLMEPMFAALEHWTISSADRLNVVSAGFLPYFEARYPNVPKVVFTNGIDNEFLDVAASIDGEDDPCRSDDDSSNGVVFEETIEVLYAGNMGEGQGLHNIVPALAKRLEGRVRFRLIGGGGRLSQLEQSLSEADVNNVFLEPPVGRAELIRAYQKADVLFLHLNDYDAFRKVLPSKLFEYGALGKPIWAGVAGYAASFVAENLDNAEVFCPCDVDAAMAAFKKLRIENRPRSSFVRRYSRKAIMDQMAGDLVSLLEARK